MRTQITKFKDLKTLPTGRQVERLFFIIFLIFQFFNSSIAQENNHINVERASTTELTWKTAGDYSSYDSLYFVVKPCTLNSCVRLIQKPVTTSYSEPYTAMACTIYVDETASFNAARYFYSIYAYGADTVWVTSGNFNLMLNGQTPTDGVPTATPYYTVALDTPAANNNFIVGMDSNNVWYQKTLAQTRTILGIDTLSGNTTADLDSLYTKTSHIVNVKEFGAVGDGVTEDSLAFQTALQYLYDAGGGELYVPEGTYLIGSQLVMPHSDTVASSYFNNRPIKIIGAGNFAQSTGISVAPANGTILKFAYSGAKNYFMITYGTGTLKFEGITFLTEVAEKAFLKIIATTSYIYNNTFVGAGSHLLASNDAIILGGTYTGNFLTDSSAFQGYGTIIKDNYFSKIRRAVYGLEYVNAVQIKDNTIWNTCGSNIDSVAAFDFDAPNSNITGNILSGNLIEANSYMYAIRFKNNGTYNILDENTIYDVGGSVTFEAVARFQNNSGRNKINATMYGSTFPAISEDASSLNSNMLFTTQQNVENKMTEPVGFYNWAHFRNSYGYKHFITDDPYRYWSGVNAKIGTSYRYEFQFVDSSTTYYPLRLLNYAGGTVVDWFTGASDLRISPSGNGNIRLWAGTTGTVWIGQTNKVYETGGNLFQDGYHSFGQVSAPSNVANRAIIYAEDISGTAQLKIINEAGEVSQITGTPSFGGMVSDSTQCTTGQLYFDATTGTVKRKF